MIPVAVRAPPRAILFMLLFTKSQGVLKLSIPESETLIFSGGDKMPTLRCLFLQSPSAACLLAMIPLVKVSFGVPSRNSFMTLL